MKVEAQKSLPLKGEAQIASGTPRGKRGKDPPSPCGGGSDPLYPTRAPRGKTKSSNVTVGSGPWLRDDTLGNTGDTTWGVYRDLWMGG